MADLGFNQDLLAYDAGSPPDPVPVRVGRRFVGSMEPFAERGLKAGLRIYWQWPNGDQEEETVYIEDLTGPAAVLFLHFLRLYTDLEKEIRAGRHVDAKGGQS